MSHPESLTRSCLGRLLRERGKAVAFGDVILAFRTVPSTNEFALAQARRGLPNGSLILADEQTAGRGRRGRAWLSPPNLGLYLTVLLRPPEGDLAPVSLLPLVASVAAVEALREGSSSGVIPVGIRWPNDLYLHEQKLAGILCEATFAGSRMESMAVGVGINVNHEPEDFGTLVGRATSLRIATGRRHDRIEVAARVVERLESWWDRWLASDTQAILVRWRELAQGERGAKVRVEREGAPFEATTAGLADDGGLRVELLDGRMLTLYSAEVVSLRHLET